MIAGYCVRRLAVSTQYALICNGDFTEPTAMNAEELWLNVVPNGVEIAARGRGRVDALQNLAEGKPMTSEIALGIS